MHATPSEKETIIATFSCGKSGVMTTPFCRSTTRIMAASAEIEWVHPLPLFSVGAHSNGFSAQVRTSPDFASPKRMHATPPPVFSQVAF